MTKFEGILRTRNVNGSTRILNDWGVNSEYGVLRKVLLGPVDHFRWMGAENLQFSSVCRNTDRLGVEFDHALAVQQHGELVNAYKSADVEVLMLEPNPHTPYQVYTRDSNVMTPYGAIVCQLANPRRRGEYAEILRFYLSHGIPVYELASAGNFEGGDFNIIDPQSLLIGYTGNRTEEVAAKQVGDWMVTEGWDVKYAPIDEFYVHIDLMVCMVAEKCAVVCEDTLSEDVSEWLKSKGVEFITANFRDTMNLAGNVVALGNDRVISTAGAKNLNQKLRAHGFEVYDPEFSMFTMAGGGVHCAAQPLRRDSV